MAGGPATRGCAGGGGSIQATSQIRTRVIAALASLLGAAALGATIATTADAHRVELGVIGLAAVLLLGASVALALPSFIPWPLVLLAGEYAWSLGGGDIDQWSPLVAGALLVVAELAYWSLELRGRTQDAERLTERRAGLIAALGIGAVLLGGFVLAATSVQLGTGISADLVGAAAAVAALAVVATLARSRR
jgi:hypothetical protein